MSHITLGNCDMIGCPICNDKPKPAADGAREFDLHVDADAIIVMARGRKGKPPTPVKPREIIQVVEQAALERAEARIAELEGRLAYRGTRDELRAENARLREALEWIAVGYKGGPKTGVECQRRARTALATERGKK